jgi:hypothetical protein
MKVDDYGVIHAAMEAADFMHMTKPEKKAALDGWLRSALDAAATEAEHFTTWEHIYLRDAISNSTDGLFYLAFDALYKATMPGPLVYNYQAAAAQDLDGITLDVLDDAADRLSHLPAQLYPIFTR